MEKGGIVSAAVVKQDDRPDKRVHQITTAGRHELRDWTGLPTPVQMLRSDFAVKIRGMQFGDRDALVTDIGRHRDADQVQLDFYFADAAKHYRGKASDEDLGAYLVLRGSVRYEQGQIDWLDEMLEWLAPR